MIRLGDCCVKGRGTAQDFVKAREWYNKALTAGNESAKERLAELKKITKPAKKGKK
jgi:TPR repeat protein